MYHLLADLVFVLHLCFICFVIAGGLLVWHWRWIAFLHLPAICWGLAIEFLDAPCPLTPLEQTLLHKAGEQAYQGGFIDHYIVPLIYPEASPSFFLEAGIVLVLLNSIIYAILIIRRRARKSAH
jgi:Protein of Unknown function (DUF2784)